MTDSEFQSTTTKTSKSKSDSGDSETTDTFAATERWSHSISYRQLVISPCIGIFQLWWHPYLHDLTKLVPFIFLYGIFSVFIGYPMFYLELALGVVTKKGVLRCWDLAPVARGVGFAMVSCCVFGALALSAVSAWCLALVVHSFHSFLPWLHCAASARPACAARHRPMTAGSETPAQSFFFNFILNLKRDGVEGGLGYVVWELSIYFVISWLLIYLIAIKGIYSYSKLVLFKDVLAFFMLLCVVLGAPRLAGAGTMFANSNWSVLLENIEIWRDALEYTLIEMSVSQGALVVLGGRSPRAGPGAAARGALGASQPAAACSALVLGAAHGALHADYDTNATNVWRGSSASMVLWSDYVARIPGSQFWSAFFFFTMFSLAITSTALLVQTIMSTLTGHSVRKVTWAFLIFICFLFCLIGTMTLCTQGGLYVLNFVMEWPVAKPRLFIAGVAGAAVTYAYGQSAFCEDVYFAVGEYPNVFVRVCWALSPPFLLAIFLTGMWTWPPGGMAGWILVVVSLLPVPLIMMLYWIFRCRVRNIVNEK